MTLVDTNVLLRFTRQADPMHPVAASAIHALRDSGERLCIVPQNLYELWVVASRPLAVNGFGLTIPECQQVFATIKSLFTLLPDPPGLFDEWESLVTTFQIQGKPAHDARLVAGMRVHGVARVLTFNTADFARFPAVAAIDPASVGTGP